MYRQHDTSTCHKNIAVSRTQPKLPDHNLSTRRDEDFFKKDACTSTETCEVFPNKIPSLDQHHKPENESGGGDRILLKKLDELKIPNKKHQRLDNKPDISSGKYCGCSGDNDPEIYNVMDPRFRYESDYDKKPLRVFHAQR